MPPKRTATYPKSCPYCGSQFNRQTYKDGAFEGLAHYRNRSHCSRQCWLKRNAGPNHHWWKGGLTYHKGYHVVSATTKGVHRVVMERYIGRPLRHSEVVHHKDGNRLNNVLSNLEIMTHSEHGKHHMAEHQGERVITKKGYIRLKCELDGQKRYYYRHRKKLLQYGRTYRLKHKENEWRRHRLYYLKNRERLLAKHREWERKQGGGYQHARYLSRKLSKIAKLP